MLPACFELAESVFPRVRAQAAKGLVAQGWSQSRTAQHLGVSQAMVSKYLTRDADDDPLVVRLADDLVHATDDVSWCDLLQATQTDAAGEAMRDLLAAEQALLADPPLGVMPQIGLNLARSLPGAARPEGVLAYPGRIIAAGDRLVRPTPPAPGGSNHLARCLLALQARGHAACAIANVRGGPDIVAAVEALGWSLRTLPDGDDVDARFEAVADGKTKVYHDPGALGIEPCLYLADVDARAVAVAILGLHKVTK